MWRAVLTGLEAKKYAWTREEAKLFDDNSQAKPELLQREMTSIHFHALTLPLLSSILQTVSPFLLSSESLTEKDK